MKEKQEFRNYLKAKGVIKMDNVELNAFDLFTETFLASGLEPKAFIKYNQDELLKLPEPFLVVMEYGDNKILGLEPRYYRELCKLYYGYETKGNCARRTDRKTITICS